MKRTNIIEGQKFGRLTAIKMVPRLPNRLGIAWEFLCDCGKSVAVEQARVRSGAVKSCGCLYEEYRTSLPRVNQLVGKKFGRLTVLSYHSKGGQRRARWLCQCDCGKEKVVSGTLLRNGNCQSCGCLQREAIRKTGHANGDGDTRTLTGVSWTAMMQRCHNPRVKAYPDYGGRGIKVCAFIKEGSLKLAEVIGFRHSREVSLDRIDNALGYFCGNCEECRANGWPMNLRWSNRTAQSRNRRTATLFEIEGVRKTIGEWAEAWNVSYTTARYRIWHKQREIEETVIAYEI